MFKAHRRLYHSTLGLRVIKKKRVKGRFRAARCPLLCVRARSWASPPRAMRSTIQGYLPHKKTPCPRTLQ